MTAPYPPINNLPPPSSPYRYTNELPQDEDEPMAIIPGAAKEGSSFFGRIIFQRLLIFSVIRISIYLFKLYEDIYTVKEYKKEGEVYYFLITLCCLAVPPIFYAIYLTGSNFAKEDVLDSQEITTKTVNGLLLIPWQIKRHLDVLHFAAQRVCLFRSPNESEAEDVQTLKRNSEILEFFEDLYAGFLQIFLQLYLFFFVFDESKKGQLSPHYYKEPLIASCLCVVSMLVAVRRRDDGPLTGFLSFFGWSSLIISRVLAFSFVATQIRGYLFALCLAHVLIFTTWIYKIAIDSWAHNNGDAMMANDSSPWTHRRKRWSLLILVFLFFGIPSLLIWPIMFQLKEKRRPLVFLMTITVENFFLLAIWYVCQVAKEGWLLRTAHVLIVIAIVLTTLAGVFILLLYVFCKPKYTDQVVLYEIRESRSSEAPTFIKLNGLNSKSWNMTQYGIYYEFCDLVFKLPSTHKIATGLDEVRRLQDQM